MTQVRDYIIKIFDGMAKGLFASLLIGLIMIQIGELTGASIMVDLGTVAQVMMGPAIGAGIALVLEVDHYTLVSAITLGAIGAGTITTDGGALIANIGEPVGALIAAWVGIVVGDLIEGNTKVDIILVPLGSILAGGLVSYFVSPSIVYMMTSLGELINQATLLKPVPMGIAISVLMGMILTLPISSAAIGISLGLSGIAAGAATVGCAANMVGFAVGSFKENGVGGLISQGLGTSMLQIPNIIKKPIIWLPSIITSAILGPISTTIIPIEATASGSGMGTSGLVGVFSAIEAMGSGSGQWISIITMMIIAPAVLSLIITQFFRNQGWIKPNDMKLS